MNERDRRVWTAKEVIALGVRTDIPTAGEILGGLCRDEAYRAVQRGTFPVPVIKVGRRYVVPVAPILDLLSIKSDANVTGPAPPGAVDATDAALPRIPTKTAACSDPYQEVCDQRRKRAAARSPEQPPAECARQRQRVPVHRALARLECNW